ncbi:MAG: SDR family oxidoreductase [Myxococcales bacterium]|nr:SDR family oxidoreductase [Myxococcales bacterium]MCB9520259.1 SDR family oxidoreductase [Myxococcales bacterium]MCB9531373.1 SDR family oxidoreductase [Myxococcales bacterium]MCB9533554.1 SDR family oxidoreductase [Myxococcales bacterium]
MIFVTGATGYIGSYVVAGLLRGHPSERLCVLVRARDVAHAEERLWASLQLHMPFDEFLSLTRDRVEIVIGDLVERDLGIDEDVWHDTAKRITSVVHVAASLNRKSAKACFNVNLRGTLSVLRLARAAADGAGLRRFSDVSTVAVAGTRAHELVDEAGIVDWDRSDYDPYARTKKFCEHMLEELLPDVSSLVFRPSTVLGDSRFAETTQFDMVRAFVTLANMPVLPLDSGWRMDIVPANYVGAAIVKLHMADRPAHTSYNLSAGAASETYRTIVDAMMQAGHRRRPPLFAPRLQAPFERVIESLSNAPKGSPVALPASLFKVFLPYLTYDTVFDNSRVVEAMGEAPAPFSSYAYPLFRFASETGFKYPHRPWPEGVPRRSA